MLEAINSGLLALFTPQAMLFMLLGILYGLVIGILPGLGGVVAMTLLLPFTYGRPLTPIRSRASVSTLGSRKPWTTCS